MLRIEKIFYSFMCLMAVLGVVFICGGAMGSRTIFFVGFTGFVITVGVLWALLFKR